VIHGVMGGVDAGLRNVACHVPDGYRLIVPSRFGYLRSTLPPHATPALQADAYIALLDTLDIDRVASSPHPLARRPRCGSRSAWRLDFGDDVTAREPAGAGAPVQAFDGVEDGVSAAGATVDELRLQRRNTDRGSFDGVVAVRIV
jgi:hypothetical protein